MNVRVQISRQKSEGRAYCGCSLLHPQATRERVRQHVEKTGHVARFVIQDITVYSPLAVSP